MRTRTRRTRKYRRYRRQRGGASTPPNTNYTPSDPTYFEPRPAMYSIDDDDKSPDDYTPRDDDAIMDINAELEELSARAVQLRQKYRSKECNKWMSYTGLGTPDCRTTLREYNDVRRKYNSLLKQQNQLKKADLTQLNSELTQTDGTSRQPLTKNKPWYQFWGGKTRRTRQQRRRRYSYRH